MTFPTHRPRRLRRSEALRGFVRETRLTTSGLVYPMFACPGTKVRTEVSSMPGIYQQSADQIVEECREVANLGIPAVILFGLPAHKDELASEAYDANGAVQRSIDAIRKTKLELLVITDVCLCEYTSHGHCGVIKGEEVLNDPSVALLADAALSHARAGADIVAPSDMMDGRVGAIREKLDENGFENVAMLSYAAKYCSAFYGPFREAAQSSPQFGDRRSYQMDPANAREALREVALDLEEGADMIMVKPAHAVSGCDPTRAREIRRSGGCLQRERGIRDGESRGATGLARRKACGAGNSYRNSAGGRRHDPDLPCEGRSALAEGLLTPEIKSYLKLPTC